MKILVTGFDPFGEDTLNPSIEAIKALPRIIEGAQIIPLEVPTIFYKCADVVQQAIIDVKPNYILSIGQAGGRSELTPERVALNVDDARITDNIGQQPIDQKIQENGKNAYFSELPIKAMVNYMQQKNIPASISNTAGTFVCNHIMYQTLFMTATKFPEIKAGFMHIPFIPEQVIHRPNTPSMSLEHIVEGIIASIQAIIDYNGKEDLHITGGRTH